jgi:hypothetical protein
LTCQHRREEEQRMEHSGKGGIVMADKELEKVKTRMEKEETFIGILQ